MTNTLPGEPGLDYDFGYEFDYSLWVPGTRIDLLNVPWGNDYRDVVRFENRHELNVYLDGLISAGIRIEQLSYVKPNEPVRINVPHNRVQRFNYVRAHNPLQPVEPDDLVKDYYYFILDTKYVAPNTTEVILQLDVWQTYNYEISLGQCYVERGHIGIANEKQFDNYGRDYLTIPEGLNVGTEYQTVAKRTEYSMHLRSTTRDVAIVVLTTVRFNVDYGTEANPILKASTGSLGLGLPSGMEAWMWEDLGGFITWVDSMADFPWITQGITSITVVPHPKRYGADPAQVSPPGMHGGVTAAYDAANAIRYNMFQDWRNHLINDVIPDRYRRLRKFMTSPYCMIEMTTWTGTPIVLKPEAWGNPHADVMERFQPTPPNQRIIYSPHAYNAIEGFETENHGRGDDGGEYLDMQVTIQNFPTLPIINSGAILYMASNAHSIVHQRNSADWSQQRTMNAANTGYDQSTGAISNMENQTNTANQLDNQQTANTNSAITGHAAVGGVSDVLTGLIGGAGFGGGPMGGFAGVANGGVKAIGGAIDANIDIGMNLQSNSNRNLARNSAMYSNRGQASYVRDTNLSLAQFASRGDYQNEIAGINAKVQDAQLIPPNVGTQFGGESMNILHDEVGVSLRWKMIDRANMALIGEFWLRYGYAINRFMVIPINFMAMEKFTYWRMKETYITRGPMPETFKQAIRGIFEKGVTIWSHPDYIGRTDLADNEPYRGIVY